MQRLKLSISPDARVTAIYNDAHANLIDKAAKAEIRRASAVEPSPDGGWTATMNDGKVLGPYRLRQDALDAEVAYLDATLF